MPRPAFVEITIAGILTDKQEEYGPSPHYQSVSGSEYPPIMPLPQPVSLHSREIAVPELTMTLADIHSHLATQQPPSNGRRRRDTDAERKIDSPTRVFPSD